VGGQTTEITSIPADTKQIEITFERNGNSGALALDDVVVGHGTQFDAEPVESFTNFNVGDQTSYKFENLKTNKDYAYEVRATDGELFSRVSNRIYVKTSMGSGVSSVANSAFVLNVAGLEVTAGTADELIVADCTGAVVARGSYKVTLPRAGLYIITVPSQNFVKKLIAR
ncbi:MAG: fibronectin type III domain-containing protein, partial [Bacteroides sp.]|nr:fibronectin type III domain-containing protein [Bacteroides sp.]